MKQAWGEFRNLHHGQPQLNQNHPLRQPWELKTHNMLPINVIFHSCKWNDFLAVLVTHRKCSQDKTTGGKCNSERAKITGHVSSSLCSAGCQPEHPQPKEGAPWRVPGPHTGQGPRRGDTADWRKTRWSWVWSSYLKMLRSKHIFPPTNPNLQPKSEVQKGRVLSDRAWQTDTAHWFF